MNRKQFTLTTGAALGLAALALAHHVPVGLSHVSGPEILREVVFFTSQGLFGVPAYKPGAVEAPGHHDPVGLVDGDSFTLMDQAGSVETITFTAADFPDIANAVVADVVSVINAKSSLAQAIDHNGYVALRGVAGGATASLDVADGPGGPLSKLGVGGGQVFGRDDLELTISIPDPNLNLAGQTYVVLASTTPGSFTLSGKTIPIGYDALTARFIDFAVNGVAGGFVGTLDGNSDASASLAAAQLQQGFAGGYPDKMYFAYIVLGANQRRIEYVSNAFTVDFR